MKYAAKSIKGVRQQNQDAIYVPGAEDEPLVAVADGMGGHNAGDVASELAIKTLIVEMKRGGPGDSPARVIDAVNKANSVVYEASVSNSNLSGMGTTLVLALLSPRDFVAANVGDSRLYLYSNGILRQVTADHSYVAELAAAGYLTYEEAAHHPRRNLLTRALGTRPCERVDIFEVDWKKGDKLLLCSDGLYDELDNDRIIEALSCNPDEMQSACDALVYDALAAGSRDNVSAVIVLNEEAEA